MTTLRTLIQWIASRGVTPTDGEDQRLRKGIFNVAAFLACVTFILLTGPFYLWFHEPIAGWAYILFGSFICLSLAFINRVWGKYERFFTVISWISPPLHLLIYISLGGFVESGGIFLWGVTHPVMSNLIVNGPRSALRWFAVYFINLLIGMSLTPWLTPTANLPPAIKVASFALSIGFISLILTAVLTYFVNQLEQAYRLLHNEQAKAENLLLNILPKDIAAILKNDQRTIADSFESASILFADVVNFTPLSAEMSPVELVDLLNEVFSHFDTLVEKHNLEKIKTIGDCYMVAAGVPRPRPDHASVLTHLALEMRDFVSEHEFRGRRLAFRIGVNSGPVVAGVIGRKKFIYDLWGDAVNTASRMESQGQADTIQITRATYELVKDDFMCEPQGTVKVKGKGEMEVWFVVGQKGNQ